MEDILILDEFPFAFYDETFSVILASDCRMYVPLHRICQALGISTAGQTQRIQRDDAISDALVKLRLQVPYGDSGAVQTREILCLWLNRLPYWLGTIDANRITNDARRQRVILFKREFADVAWAAFRSEMLPADVLAETDATLPQSRQAYLTAMDEAAAMRRRMDEHGERLQSVEERLSGLEARLVGTDFINSAQAKQYLDMVAILGNLLKKKGAGTHATVHSEVKRRFNVPSYQLIPEKDFAAVITFLAGWYRRLTPPGTPLPGPFSQPSQGRLL